MSNISGRSTGQQMNSKQDSSPTILLLEQDDDTRPLLMHNLRCQGYRVLIALDFEDALERMDGKRKRLDLILLNQFRLSIDESINMGRCIRHRAGLSSSTPVIVIAEQYGADMEGKDILVGESEYVTYPEDGQQLINLLHRLCPV